MNEFLMLVTEGRDLRAKTYLLVKLNSNYIFSLGFSYSQYFDLVYSLLLFSSSCRYV